LRIGHPENSPDTPAPNPPALEIENLQVPDND
jgi:hypothetical protein